MSTTLWAHCLSRLESELSEQDLNTWIRPLQAEERDDALYLFAPNRFVQKHVRDHFEARIKEVLLQVAPDNDRGLVIDMGTQRAAKPRVKAEPKAPIAATVANKPNITADKSEQADDVAQFEQLTNLNPAFTFETFVEGKSNQFGRAAATQTATNPGESYNPLFLYGGTGLGKTHLMQAVGNMILQRSPNAKVLYIHAERYVREMVKALQRNTINDFKRFYHNLDALLIDDIQFFAGKERSQEEFFHTFNALFEGKQQIILTCDRYPKEVNGLEERLKSRFGWGLVVAIEPPELETRVAILQAKAEATGANLPSEVAFFIAKRIASNVRELEGALRRVIATCTFYNRPITIDGAKEALKDLFNVQDRLITIENIQRTVANYYKVKFSDLLGKSRSRSLARPRQVAMTLAKELTSHSLPEIGQEFGGRDHTTVLHATRKIHSLRQEDERIDKDYTSLLRILTT